MNSQLFKLSYTVADKEESVITKTDFDTIDDVVYLMRKVYKCKNIWYTSVESGENVRDAKQTLNYVYGSLVAAGRAGVFG